VNGVSFDGEAIWAAADERLLAVSPSSGELQRAIEVRAQAGTAFDGRHLYQLADGAIQKLDRDSGRVLSRIPAPPGDLSGMAWAEGYLWIGEYQAGKIHQVDPESGAVVRTLESNRFVTGVTWVQGELWHGTIDAAQSELRQIDPQTGHAVRRLAMPQGALVSGLESNGDDLFYCGGAASGKIRAVRRSRRRT